jgi:hypothetical protein
MELILITHLSGDHTDLSLALPKQDAGALDSQIITQSHWAQAQVLFEQVRKVRA